jgi:uncharacterized protein (DUF924 family)
MAGAREVLDFWLGEVGADGWYKGGAEIDAACARFAPLCEAARDGGLRDWLSGPDGALAYLVVTDQFSRNLYRGSALSFATDAMARDVSRQSLAEGWDMATAMPQRQFFYMPLMHSESLTDQDLCVRLMAARMPGSDDQMLHARAHREVIARFGRFPFRNAALGRVTTAEEKAFMDEGAYPALVRAMRDAAMQPAQGPAAPG